MKVLVVDLETEWRGGQNQAFLLLKGLRARGHEAELVTANNSALGERAREAGGAVHAVSRGVLRVHAARKIRQLIRAGQFDLVHANEAHAVTAVWLALRGWFGPKRVPYVISRRVGYAIGSSRLSQARYRAASKIVAISEWSAERVLRSGIPAEMVTIVYEGVELPVLPSPQTRTEARARFGVAANEPLLGCVGVLSRDKGQEWLMRSLPLVQKECGAAKLMLAGEGPCREALEQLARSLGVERSVIFTGFVEDVGAIYAALDVFLLPSMFEALSNALMSAMAYGVPSIAFKSGGPAEIIEDEKSGLLVEPKNEKGIAAAVVRVLRENEVAARFRAAGRGRIEEKFAADKMVDGMLGVYRSI